MVWQGIANRHRTHRQAVTVGRYGTQLFAFGFEQHAV
jgi:hypothetical protein